MHSIVDFINLHLRSWCVGLDDDWSFPTAPQSLAEAIFRLPNDTPRHRVSDTPAAKKQVKMKNLLGKLETSIKVAQYGYTSEVAKGAPT